MNGVADKQIIYKSSGGSYIYNLEVTVGGVVKNFAIAVMQGFKEQAPTIVSKELLKLMANEFNRSLPNAPENIANLFEQNIEPAITALGFAVNLDGAGQNWGGWNATGKIAQSLTGLAADKKPAATALSAAGLSTWFGANGSATGETPAPTAGTDPANNDPTPTPTNSASALWTKITTFAKENPVAAIAIVFVIGFLIYMGVKMYQKNQVEKKIQFAKGAELKALKKEYQRLAA